MRMSERPDDNLASARATASATRRRQGATLVCLPELFRIRYFCQSEDAANFALAEPVPGPTTERLAALAAELERRRSSLSAVRARAPRALSQHGGRAGRGTRLRRQVPQDAHPGRSALLREVLLHAGRPRLQVVRRRPSAPSACSSAGTSGIRKPRASLRSRARKSCCYPTAIGWHPEERGRAGRAPARRVGNDAARARDRERLLRVAAEPDRLRARPRPAAAASSSGARASSPAPDGRIVARASVDRDEDRLRRRSRSERDRAVAHRLAVPARSPHRCLRGHHATLHRLAPVGAIIQIAIGATIAVWRPLHNYCCCDCWCLARNRSSALANVCRSTLPSGAGPPDTEPASRSSAIRSRIASRSRMFSGV